MTSFRNRVNLRGFGKLFTNLPPGVRAKIEAAFLEAETLLDYHNKSDIEKQTRRSISGLVAAPVLTTFTSPGAIHVTWRRLTDRRISKYEIEYDDSQIFDSPTSKVTVDTFFDLNGLSGDWYFRVRGVTGDGRTGRWSATATDNPDTTLFDTSSHDKTELDTTTILDVAADNGGWDDWQELGTHTHSSTGTSAGVVIWGTYGQHATQALTYNKQKMNARALVNGGTYEDGWLRLDAAMMGMNYEDEDYFIDLYQAGSNDTDANIGLVVTWGPVFVKRPFTNKGILYETKTGNVFANNTTHHAGSASWVTAWVDAGSVATLGKESGTGSVERSDACYQSGYGFTLPGATASERVVGYKMVLTMNDVSGNASVDPNLHLLGVCLDGSTKVGSISPGTDWNSTYTKGYRAYMFGMDADHAMNATIAEVKNSNFGTFWAVEATTDIGARYFEGSAVCALTIYYEVPLDYTTDVWITYEAHPDASGDGNLTVENCTTNFCEIGLGN